MTTTGEIVAIASVSVEVTGSSARGNANAFSRPLLLVIELAPDIVERCVNPNTKIPIDRNAK